MAATFDAEYLGDLRAWSACSAELCLWKEKDRHPASDGSWGLKLF